MKILFFFPGYENSELNCQNLCSALDKTSRAVYDFAKELFTLYAKRIISSIYYFAVYKVPLKLSLCSYVFESLFTYLFLPQQKLSTDEELQKGNKLNKDILNQVMQENGLVKKALLLAGIVAKTASQVFFDSSRNMSLMGLNWTKMFLATALSLLSLNFFMSVPLYFVFLNLLYFCYLILLIAGIYLIQNVPYFETIQNFDSLSLIDQVIVGCNNWLFFAKP